MPLAHDMIGLYFAVGNANHLPPWGGLDMLLSTNPIAAAIPAGDENPIVLDMATTVAAYGKVKTKALRGETMPEGWMIDREGKPLTDPKRADEGMLLPLGGMEAGYKGYGLAMIIGLLAGTLGGAAMGRDVIDFNHDDDSVTNTGQAIAAINIAAFGDVATFKRSVDALVRDFRNSQRMPGVDRIWVPGERSHETRLRRTSLGIPIAPALLRGLDQVADELGIARLMIVTGPLFRKDQLPSRPHRSVQAGHRRMGRRPHLLTAKVLTRVNHTVRFACFCHKRIILPPRYF